MIKINLLPVKEAKKKATLQNQIIAAGIVLLVVIIGVGYIAYLRKQTINRLNQEIAAQNKRLAELKEIQKKSEEFKKANEELAQKIGVITDLETGRDWYLQIIDQLSEAMPEGVWIDSLSALSKGGLIYNATWEIKGGALEKDQVGNLISNLESRNKYFKSVSLKKISKTNRSGLGICFSYEISITVNQPPKPKIEAG